MEANSIRNSAHKKGKVSHTYYNGLIYAGKESSNHKSTNPVKNF